MFTKPTPAWKNVIMTFLGAPAAKAFDCTGDATHPVCCPSGAVVGSTATDCELDRSSVFSKIRANDTLGVKAAVITLYVPQKTDGLLTTTLCGINPDSLLLTQAACCESVWPTGGFFVSYL